MVSIDVNQVLLDAGITFSFGATKVNLNLDNVLVSISETGTVSSIAKKDFDGLSITVVPEPSTTLLIGFGLAALGVSRRR